MAQRRAAATGLVSDEARVQELAERVTVLEELNRELSRSNDELLDFASVASHELRAPLQTIMGYVDLLADHMRAGIDEEAAAYLADINRGTQRLRSLVDALLSYARVGTGVRRRDDLDCDDLLAECVQSLAAQFDETGATITVGPLPTVVGDPDELGLVFRNLLTNALKFGRPDVALEIDVSARRVGQTWRFLVADNGTGIEPAERSRVFRLFQSLPGQTRQPGSGVGLAVCQRIVEGHGGKIWADDGTDGGAGVYFTMPAPVCWSPFG